MPLWNLSARVLTVAFAESRQFVLKCSRRFGIGGLLVAAFFSRQWMTALCVLGLFCIGETETARAQV
jgi:hypothetical protein